MPNWATTHHGGCFLLQYPHAAKKEFWRNPCLIEYPQTSPQASQFGHSKETIDFECSPSWTHPLGLCFYALVTLLCPVQICAQLVLPTKTGCQTMLELEVVDFGKGFGTQDIVPDMSWRYVSTVLAHCAQLFIGPRAEKTSG